MEQRNILLRQKVPITITAKKKKSWKEYEKANKNKKSVII